MQLIDIQKLSNVKKFIHVIHYTSKRKMHNHSHRHLIKFNIHFLLNEGYFSFLVKSVKLYPNHFIQNVKILEAFPLKSGNTIAIIF